MTDETTEDVVVDAEETAPEADAAEADAAAEAAPETEAEEVEAPAEDEATA